MGQVLRVTVGQAEHAFKLLGMNITDREKAELEIELSGETFKIIREGRSWIAVGATSSSHEEIAESIGKALALRYRF
ncbi:hypothetical protein BDD43_0099 [Mucilaginibacter gracilis]|uniref:Uncharacterized protein n=2 Tax=Mucilaginibacter gracilis TaxID=423350 RepID=A0A495IUN5_9SPHI|nr:hypothetical protein BDD43_0099 [Mucilaginibacter gracilis]